MHYEGYKCYYEFDDIVHVLNYYAKGVHIPSKGKPALKKDLKNNVPYKTSNRKAFWEENDIVDYLEKVLSWRNNVCEAFRFYRAENDIKRYSNNDSIKEYYLELEKERFETITAILNQEYSNKDEMYDKLNRIDHIIDYIIKSRMMNDFYRNWLDAQQRVYFDGDFRHNKVAAYIADHFRAKAIESGMYD